MRDVKTQALSLGLHAAGLAILLFLASRPIATLPPVARDAVALIAPLRWRPAPRKPDHAGGSNRTSLPARQGSPPPTAHRTFIPPTYVPAPKLPIAIGVAFETPTLEIDPSQIGDPNGKLRAGGLGMNGDNGIGKGCCRGIGDDNAGRPGIGSSTSGHRITPPQLIYKVEPEFSEEARKAKYQGTVLLAIEVDASGHAKNFRILQGLGLGLDQKAIEAVSQWRFRPGAQDGKPVTTSATVEVNFRLL